MSKEVLPSHHRYVLYLKFILTGTSGFELVELSFMATTAIVSSILMPIAMAIIVANKITCTCRFPNVGTEIGSYKIIFLGWNK